MKKPEKRPLTAEEWAALRVRWEGAAEPGFTALAAEVLTAWGVVISRQGIADMARRRGWAKSVQPSQQMTVKKPTMGSGAAPAEGEQLEVQAAQVLAQVAQAAQAPEVADEVVDAESDRTGPTKRGRPTKFRPVFATMIVEHFDKEPFTEVDVPQPSGLTKRQRMATDLPTLSSFAKTIGVSVDTLGRWATEVLADGGMRHPDFAEAYARAREMQEALIVRGGLLGLYEPRTVQAALKNLHGWQDQPAQKVAVAAISREELDRIYGKAMERSRERMEALREERTNLW